MKTKLFRTALLLLMPTLLVAQGNGITITNLSVAPGTVTFKVEWKNDHPAGFLWSDTAWVFVDYNNAGTMTRLQLTGATLTAPSWAGASITRPNNKGAWVAGNARDHSPFTATVKLYTDVAFVSGACAYAINYPPLGKYTAGDKIEFTGTPPYTVTFTLGDPETVQANQAKPYPIPAGKTIASFTDKSGAPGTFSCKLATVQTLTASAAGYCEGPQGVTFSLSGTESGATYQLIKDNTTVVASLTGNGSSSAFDGNYTAGVYTARIVPGAFCASTMTGKHTVTEYPKPVISTTAPPMICYNTTANLTADVTSGATDAMTYTWTIGTTSSTTTVNSKTSQQLTVNIDYSVSVTNANGCTATSTEATIPVAANLTQGTPVAQTPICHNTTATLNLAAASGGIGVITYKWEQSSDGNSNWTPATGTETNTGQNYTTPKLTGNMYYHRIATSLGCNSITSESALVTVNTPPTIGTQPQSKSVCESSTSISVTASAGSGATLSYQWWKQGSGAIGGATGSSYSVTASGDYWVVVTDNNTCSVTSDVATVTLNSAAGGQIGTGDAVNCGYDGGRIGNNG
jgi:hypothetical protein